MNSFIQRHQDKVIGQLNGFDRIRFRGTLRRLSYVRAMMSYLWDIQVLLKDFGGYADSVRRQICQATEQVAQATGRPLNYVSRSSLVKEDLVRSIALKDGISQGLICILSALEPCQSYEIYRDRVSKQIELQSALRKCLHYYHYYLDPELGFLSIRLQTWLPMTMHICINGREWLARQMDAAGIGYVRRDNCFVQIADVERAQQLMDRQLHTNWPRLLDRLGGPVNPAHGAIFKDQSMPYYWSAQESEWASDVMFHSAAALSGLYPRLIHHGMTTLGSREVLRFLGRKLPAHGGINGHFAGDVVSDLAERPEGMRVKHRVKRNSIKMYNKQSSVLRVETTVNDPADFKAYRAKEGDPEGAKQWRQLRRGVADLYRRAEVCQAANERYLESLATVDQAERLGELVEPLCQPVRWKKKRVRGLNPLSGQDARVLEAIARGEFLINGFRNRDLRGLLFGQPTDAAEKRRQSGQVTRTIRLLRAHGLIHKRPHTHRYVLSPAGHKAITALLAARQADTETLIRAA